MKSTKSFYNPFHKMSFTDDRCFLCGKKLKTKTAEHVFPKWLLNEYDLWNQKIFLLNGTTINYWQLTIPCCEECNNIYLSKVENQIKKSYFKGFNDFVKVGKLVVYQWIGKIFYGLLFRELSLSLERTDPEKGSITNPDLLKDFKTFHFFLQSIRAPFEFVNFKPWSIFILNLHIDDNFSQFDYRDSFIFMTFSIRMGNIGIVACLRDNGAQNDLLQDYYRKLQKIKLHPIQFDELCAKVTYKSSLFNRNPKYMTIMSENKEEATKVITFPLQGLSSKPVYDDWIQKEYARYLANFLKAYNVEFDVLFKEPNQVMTFIEENKKIKVLNEKGEIEGYI